ncbi:cytochrome c oxidase subunit 3 [Candidatus Binatia bacterium]|nr:cytochrome c oxidase subunit 3 [Candidatus Binatia bacterium]
MVLFLGVETFVFLGLLTIALALRAAAAYWPPASLPPLPVMTTWVHTGILLFSAVTMRRAMAAADSGRRFDIETGLAATALLGFAFVAGQSAELVWMFSAGFAPASGGYTATFLVLVAGVGAHVLCGVFWIVAATTGVVMGGRTIPVSGFVRSCAIFWYYGCGLWVPVFALLYLL